MTETYENRLANAQATTAVIVAAMRYTQTETIEDLMAFCRKFDLSPAQIARIADAKAVEEPAWDRRHSEVFDSLDPQSYRDFEGTVVAHMAGDEPTREELIACRLMTTLIFDEDEFGALVVDYPTVLKLAQELGEHLLSGLDELIEVNEYIRNRTEAQS